MSLYLSDAIALAGGLSKTITKLEHTHQMIKKRKESQQHCRDTSFRLKLENMWQTPPPPVFSKSINKINNMNIGSLFEIANSCFLATHNK